jgi:hypothetical protein
MSSFNEAMRPDELRLRSWVEARIVDCKDHLNLISQAFAQELAKPIIKRQRAYLTFLDKERSVYTFALEQLEGVLAIMSDDKHE